MKPQGNTKSLLYLLPGIALMGLIIVIWGFISKPSPLAGTARNDSADVKIFNASNAASLASLSDIPDGLFNYGGSTTFVPLRAQLEPFIEQTFPEFELRYTSPYSKTPGSSVGIEMLLEGQLSFSESSRPLKPQEYDTAQQRGIELEQIPIAIDGIAVAVHPSLAVDGLTISQLGDIYQGLITNWSEVGGPDLPIQPFSRPPSAAGTPEFFVENVMNGADFGQAVQFVDSTTAGLRQVESTLGGLYFASAPEIVPQCQVKTLPLAGADGAAFVPAYQAPLVRSADCPEQRNQLNVIAFRSGSYPLTRRLFVIVKVNGSTDEAAGRAYTDILLSPEGQTLIEQAGFVSIR
ncbi:MAG: PstS family phosphate ABC transporter substrate-binding protein [Leptolyngbya sp. SIO4C1]|nr:PstS family phosphate ABC transporter substrate-binding protein [Leptolyngbya sp. SIO4C1]